MGNALASHLPQAEAVRGMGGSSYWVRFPDEIDTEQLASKAYQKGIFVEPGGVYFHEPARYNALRLGFSSIDSAKIEPGIKKLSGLI